MLLDFGNFKYKQQKQERQAKKSVKSHIVKELKVSPKISENDYQVRVKRAREFLGKGFKVKLTVPFKGREIVHADLGYSVANRFIDDVKELGEPDSSIGRAHRALTVFIIAK